MSEMEVEQAAISERRVWNVRTRVVELSQLWLRDRIGEAADAQAGEGRLRT